MQKRNSKSIPSNACGNCKTSPLANAPSFMSCGVRKFFSYCCKECQKVDWPRHKLTCKTEGHNTKFQKYFTIARLPMCFQNKFGYVKCVNLPLQHTVDPNIADKYNATPLWIASQNGHDSCVSALLQHEADPNIADKDATAPLHVACELGFNKCALLLLQAGAMVDAPDTDGETPLQSAISIGHLNV